LPLVGAGRVPGTLRARDWPATLDAEGEASSRRRRSHRPTKIIN